MCLLSDLKQLISVESASADETNTPNVVLDGITIESS